MTRITKREARQRFNAGEVVVLCPRKTLPTFPHSFGANVSKVEFENEWGADPWQRMLDHWTYYNACFELGYYPHYYRV